MLALLFPGLPGGPELLIVVLILGLFLIPLPLLLAAGAYVVGKRRGREEATRDGDAEATDR
ncbi:hypothetical protein ACFQGE_01930 [Halomicroarcula sp. GCM10025817]|uniref:hypothetical protein n=1 Tax=Haloarcula TaxID=2237 RepID=UPI0023E79974|nr:hypothetical protein [Halomicroarcula sp. SYNS111]